MSELDYWTGFRDALEALKYAPSKMNILLSRARDKVEELKRARVYVNPSDKTSKEK